MTGKSIWLSLVIFLSAAALSGICVAAELEVGAVELDRFSDADLRERVLTRLQKAGYKYVCLDLQGYRTGAMNEVLGD